MFKFKSRPEPEERVPCSVIRIRHYPHPDGSPCLIKVECRCGRTHRFQIHAKTTT